MEEKRICNKCKQKKLLSDFYKHIQAIRNNEGKLEKVIHFSSQCKDCIQNQYNPFDSKTFLWLLEELDCPFYKDEYNKYLSKNIDNKRAVLGKYLSYMNLHHWLLYEYKDSEEINNLYKKYWPEIVK